MGKARNLADLLDANGDVKSASLDNVPASNNASALTTGTLPMARLSGTLPALNASALTAIPAANITGTLPAISGANLTNLTSTFNGLTDTTVSTSDPATNSNPSATGHLWVNKTSGESYVCTNATSGANVWTNIGSASGDVTPTYNVDYLVIAGAGRKLKQISDGLPDFMVHTSHLILDFVRYAGSWSPI